MKILLQAALVLAVGLVSSSCAYTDVTVNATAQPDAKKKIAYFVDDVSAVGERDSLRTKEVEKAVLRALAGRGMYDVPNREMASVVVTVDYGIGPPVVHRETYESPIMRPVMETVTVNDQTGTDEMGNPIYTTRRYQQPAGFVETGQTSKTEVDVVEYEKHLTLSARERDPNPASGVAPISWEVQVSTSGESKDLRKSLPLLAATAMEYATENTPGPVVIRIPDPKGDPYSPVTFIQDGMAKK